MHAAKIEAFSSPIANSPLAQRPAIGFNASAAVRYHPRAESALFNFAWLTAPGSAVFVAALLSMAMLRMSRAQVAAVVRRTFFQMKIPIPTIACMLGLDRKSVV